MQGSAADFMICHVYLYIKLVFEGYLGFRESISIFFASFAVYTVSILGIGREHNSWESMYKILEARLDHFKQVASLT